MMVNIGFDWILYTQIIGYFRWNLSFSESKKQNRYLIMNLLSFSVTSIFHVILVEKQLIKHNIFFTLSDFQFSTYVPIEVIPVSVARSNGTPMGTSREQL